MRVKRLPTRFLAITLCLAIISILFSFQTIQAQTKPLTLAQVLTSLQSKSSGASLSEKNAFLTNLVQKNGITFKLTPEFERELRNTGASTSLIRAIRLKNPGSTDVGNSTKPTARIVKSWMVLNVVKDGVKGVNVWANFNLYNLQSIKTSVKFRFQLNEKYLTTNTKLYKGVNSQLRGIRHLTAPRTNKGTGYKNIGTFIPYTVFNLSPGVHNLKLDVDIDYRDGKLLTHIDLQDVRLVIPAPRIVKKRGTAEFKDIWMDYGESENGKLGMRVHVKMTVRGMKDQNAYLQLLFTKADGSLLYAKSPSYQSKSGNRQTAGYRLITPIYPSSNFSDVSVFIPYDEFNLRPGRYGLKIHADLVYSDFTPVQHLTYKEFTYSKSR